MPTRLPKPPQPTTVQPLSHMTATTMANAPAHCLPLALREKSRQVCEEANSFLLLPLRDVARCIRAYGCIPLRSRHRRPCRYAEQSQLHYAPLPLPIPTNHHPCFFFFSKTRRYEPTLPCSPNASPLPPHCLPLHRRLPTVSHALYPLHHCSNAAPPECTLEWAHNFCLCRGPRVV